jgi:hypothetical protein
VFLTDINEEAIYQVKEAPSGKLFAKASGRQLMEAGLTVEIAITMEEYLKSRWWNNMRCCFFCWQMYST